MRAVLTFFILLASISLFSALSDAQTLPQNFFGSYVGSGYIYNAAGSSIKSEFRLSLAPGPTDGIRLELLFLEDQVARFTKVKENGKTSLRIDEEVLVGSSDKAVATGKLALKGGKMIAGTIVISLIDENAKKHIVRTMKFLVERLGEINEPENNKR